MRCWRWCSKCRKRFPVRKTVTCSVKRESFAQKRRGTQATPSVWQQRFWITSSSTKPKSDLVWRGGDDCQYSRAVFPPVETVKQRSWLRNVLEFMGLQPGSGPSDYTNLHVARGFLHLN